MSRPNIENLFGDRTWNDVRRYLTNKVSRRFSGASRVDIEDVVSEAIVDLVDYWMDVDSSLCEDTGRNFAYAVKRGWWVASKAMIRRYRANEQELSFGEFHGEDYTAESVDESQLRVLSFDDPDLDGVDELDEQARARRVLAELSEAEWSKWATGMLVQGNTVKEQAKLDGIGETAVRLRRETGVRNIAPLAIEAGVWNPHRKMPEWMKRQTQRNNSSARTARRKAS